MTLMQAKTANNFQQRDLLTDEQISYISSFVYQRSGIVLGTRKRYLIESRLKSVARIAGMRSVAALVAELSKHQPQLDTLVLDALTTNETSWFRDRKPFDALQNVILPQLKRTKTAQVLNIWSAACSSGQEPYSIAMTIVESGLFTDWHVRIVATDISTKMLEQAKEGIYTQMEVNRGLPISYLIRYFTQIGDVWKLKPEITNMVTFKKHRLQDSPTALGKFDLIFCRNVLIYFDLETKRRILRHLGQVLEDRGLLALGGAETTLNLSDHFEPLKPADAVFYAKTDVNHGWHDTK